MALPSLRPPIPNGFCCPILHVVMDDPVICADGNTYERSAIERWLQQPRGVDGATGQLRQARSPMTNLDLPHVQLTENRALRNAIRAWVEHYPDLVLRPARMDLEDVRAAVEAMQAEADVKRGAHRAELERFEKMYAEERAALRGEVATMKEVVADGALARIEALEQKNASLSLELSAERDRNNRLVTSLDWAEGERSRYEQQIGQEANGDMLRAPPAAGIDQWAYTAHVPWGVVDEEAIAEDPTHKPVVALFRVLGDPRTQIPILLSSKMPMVEVGIRDLERFRVHIGTGHSLIVRDKHFVLKLGTDNKVSIMCLCSIHGPPSTFVNGHGLWAYGDWPLEHGDKIAVGQHAHAAFVVEYQPKLQSAVDDKIFRELKALLVAELRARPSFSEELRIVTGWLWRKNSALCASAGLCDPLECMPSIGVFHKLSTLMRAKKDPIMDLCDDWNWMLYWSWRE